MNGPGTAPPQPPHPTGNGAAIGVRVLFVVMGYLGVSLLNWVLLLRLALVRRRVLDWVVFVVVGFVLPGVLFSFISDGDEITGAKDATGVFGSIALWFSVPAYFAVMDSHYRRLALAAAAAVPPFTAPAPYPYAQHQHQHPVPVPPQPYNYNPYRVDTPTPPPTAVPPPRINQVRAELDELSDLLRKQEGGEQ